MYNIDELSNTPFKVTPREKFNTYSHLLASIVFFVIGIVLIYKLNNLGKYQYIFPTLIYIIGLFLTYFSSALYHAAFNPRLKTKFRILDHCCIFISIAASYTPLLLISFRDSVWAKPFLIILWILTLIGIYYEIILGKNDYQNSRKPSFIVFLIMYIMLWLLLPKFLMTFSWVPLLVLLASVLATTIGTYYYAQSKKQPEKEVLYHGIWHVLVFASSLLFFAFYCLTIYNF
ncbi:MAG: hemolysin III family protein [Neisseriaceae bacterium]|nr:hemolysin III family protein [Neisseriaceae bacterium]